MTHQEVGICGLVPAVSSTALVLVITVPQYYTQHLSGHYEYCVSYQNAHNYLVLYPRVKDLLMIKFL